MPVGYGAHFSKKWLVSISVGNPQSGHARSMSCLHCDLSELLEQTRPPDPDLVDLIEQAFLEGQIDSRKADLAYLFLESEKQLFQMTSMGELH